MKYVNGSPKQLYVVTSQITGESEAFTNLREARANLKLYAQQATLATYILKEKK